MSGLSSLCAPNATGKGKRLIIFHIRSKEGFVDGGLLFFEPKKGSTDYHDEMKGDLFVDWLTDVISLLKQVHFSNGQCALPFGKTRTTTLCWKKKDITKWLKDKGGRDTYTTLKSWKSSNHDIINMWLTVWRIYQIKRNDSTYYVHNRTTANQTRLNTHGHQSNDMWKKQFNFQTSSRVDDHWRHHFWWIRWRFW